MLQAWVEVLPLFVVRLLARKCERTRVGTKMVHVPRPGVMIEVEEKLPSVPNTDYYGSVLGVGA